MFERFLFVVAIRSSANVTIATLVKMCDFCDGDYVLHSPCRSCIAAIPYVVVIMLNCLAIKVHLLAL